ncbi:Cytochrome b5 [Chlorella sorokiniana]|uniref:Cytochrome b5 n=1 Tax=Chlorella sorokiniana TaxID=3076 RepID=A0A2P6TUF4_CHLSO|nr:Cytochrome b5 [Chlorella sorokiniana]|eukprot:PRW57707.1 Cytochrome b5 [Chlorella sorokiniana]
MALEQLLQQARQQLERLQQLGSPQEVLHDPLVRGVIAAVLCLLFLLLLLQPSGTKEKQSKGKPKPRELRGYTRAEVAQHKAEDDLWLIIKNKGSDRLKVYDVTAYIEHHPGGDAIFWHAGDDCTEGFHGIQHPPTVYDLVEEYCIGWLEDP